MNYKGAIMTLDQVYKIKLESNEKLILKVNEEMSTSHMKSIKKGCDKFFGPNKVALFAGTMLMSLTKIEISDTTDEWGRVEGAHL